MNQGADIRSRLSRLAKERRVDMQLLLTTYGIQRALFRLGATDHAHRYVLKGAQQLQTFAAERSFRATRDVDLSARGDPNPLTLQQTILDLAALDEADGLEFDLDSLVIEEIRSRAEYGGLRARLWAHLDGARIPLRLDVGFGDSLVPAAVPIRMQTLLDMPAPALRGYLPEAIAAETLHALTALGLLNSRLKDYYDLWFIADRVTVDDDVLVEAIVATFSRRDTRIDPAPPGLSEAYWGDEEKRRMWRGFLRNAAASAPSLEEVCHAIRDAYLPAAARAVRDATHEAAHRSRDKENHERS